MTLAPPPRNAWVPPGLADLTDPDVFLAGAPHAAFARLRSEAPVAWHPQGDGDGFWCVTRWQDVRAVSLDQRTFSSWRGGIMLRDFPEELLAAQRETLTAMEPGRHQAHRKLVSAAFVPRVIRELEPRLRTVTRDILDTLDGRSGCDFVVDVAAELPVVAICELLGIPREDRGRVIAWSNKLVGMDDPEYAGSPDDGPLAALELAMYAQQLAEERRSAPRDDILSQLLAAEVDGERLGDAAFNAFVLVLAVAGNETTRNLISGGLHTLFEHPAAREAVVANPALLPTAIEEMLRWVTPVMHFRRTAERDVELGGRVIRAGDKVVMWYVAANRDETVFARPDVFDITRSPNDHLAFGFGPHYCLGASLAQLEVRVLFEELFGHYPEIAPAGPIARMRANHIAGIKHMPVQLGPRRNP